MKITVALLVSDFFYIFKYFSNEHIMRHTILIKKLKGGKKEIKRGKTYKSEGGKMSEKKLTERGRIRARLWEELLTSVIVRL